MDALTPEQLLNCI